MIDPGKRDPSILHRVSFPGSGKRPAWAALSCASILYACCIALFFFPALGDFRGALIGPPEDNMQDLWNAWHSQTAFASNGKSFFFTRGIFFPEGTSLLYHSFSYVNLFPVFLLRNLFGLTLDIHGLTALNNSMLLLSFYFAAMGMFFLALDFTQDTFSAMVAGYIFAFSPFHFAHSLHHVHIATIQFIPFFALCSLRYIQKPSMLSYIGAVAFFTLSALSSWYYLIYNIYFILFYAGYCAIKNGIRALKATSGPMMAVLAGGFILLSPLVVPMMIAGIADRNAYAIGHSHGVYVADLAGFLIFHPYHLLNDLTQRINDRFTGNVWEMSVYLGVVNLALLLWAIKKRKTIRIPTLGFCLSGMAFFMLFAAGHSLHILGQPTPLLLPTAVTESLPFLSHLRTSSRAVVYVYLFLAIAIGAILRKLCFEPEGWFYRWQRRPGHRMAVTAAILALIFADFYSIAW